MGGVFSGHRGPLRRHHPQPRALCRLGRRARHGQLRRARTPFPSATGSRKFHVHNPQVTLDADDAGRERAHGPLDRRTPQPDGWAGALLPARRRRLRARCAAASRSGIRTRTPRCSARWSAPCGQTGNRQIIRVRRNINDPEFTAAIVSAFRPLLGRAGGRRQSGEVTHAQV